MYKNHLRTPNYTPRPVHAHNYNYKFSEARFHNVLKHFRASICEMSRIWTKQLFEQNNERKK